MKNTAAKKTLLLGRVKIATHNLFQIINRHLKQHGTVPIENTPLQLDKVAFKCVLCLWLSQNFKETEFSFTNKWVENFFHVCERLAGLVRCIFVFIFLNYEQCRKRLESGNFVTQTHFSR